MPKCATTCTKCGRAFIYLNAYMHHESECGKAEEEDRKLLAKCNVVKVQAVGNRRRLTPLINDAGCKRCGRRFGSAREAALHSKKCRCLRWNYRCLSCDTIIKLKSGVARHHATCTGIVQPTKHSHKYLNTVLLTRKTAGAQCRFCKMLFLTLLGSKKHALSCSRRQV